MKKFDLLKTIQLIIFTAFAAICIALVLLNKDLYHAIASNPTMKLICGLLWFCFGLTFIFIFIDFNFISSYKKDYNELEHAVNTDHVSGLANRKSLDEFIEQHRKECLPCIALYMTSIEAINKAFDREAGDKAIQDFSNILMLSSVNLCTFVGRNDGLNILAFFEKNASQDKLDAFLEDVQKRVAAYNMVMPQKAIEYKYGIAFNEGTDAGLITDMIKVSLDRAHQEA